jgi:deuterolysin
MKLLLNNVVISCLVSVIFAASVDLGRRDSPFSVEIQMTQNSHIKATVTNTGSSDIKILRTGSILDPSAIEKSNIFQGCK